MASAASKSAKVRRAPKVSEPQKKCFLRSYCHDQNSIQSPDIDQVSAFNEEKFEKCHRSLHIRRNLKLKYKDVCLTCRISPNVGYHSKCYSNFTALKREHVEKSEAIKPYEVVASRAYSPSRQESTSDTSVSDTSVHDSNEANQSNDSSSVLERYVHKF